MNNFSTINNQSSLTQFANMQKDINWLKENKKQEIKKNYEANYKYYKMDSYFGLGASSIMLLGGLATQKKNPYNKIFTILGAIGLLGYPFYKPKKEKYDAAMQKELNEVI